MQRFLNAGGKPGAPTWNVKRGRTCIATSSSRLCDNARNEGPDCIEEAKSRRLKMQTAGGIDRASNESKTAGGLNLDKPASSQLGVDRRADGLAPV